MVAAFDGWQAAKKQVCLLMLSLHLHLMLLADFSSPRISYLLVGDMSEVASLHTRTLLLSLQTHVCPQMEQG